MDGPVFIVNGDALHKEVGSRRLHLQSGTGIHVIPHTRRVAAASVEAVGGNGHLFPALTYQMDVGLVHMHQTAVVIGILSSGNLLGGSSRARLAGGVACTVTGVEREIRVVVVTFLDKYQIGLCGIRGSLVDGILNIAVLLGHGGRGRYALSLLQVERLVHHCVKDARLWFLLVHHGKGQCQSLGSIARAVFHIAGRHRKGVGAAIGQHVVVERHAAGVPHGLQRLVVQCGSRFRVTGLYAFVVRDGDAARCTHAHGILCRQGGSHLGSHLIGHHLSRGQHIHVAQSRLRV